MTDRLVYLSLGEGRHVDELRFSVLSADRFRSPGADWAVRLYTDQPTTFADLPADVREVTPEMRERWAGPHGYLYRGKIEALADSLADPDTTRAAVIDGDTYFVRSPAKLLARIAPGRSVVHRREGRPHPPEIAALQLALARHTPVDLAGRELGVHELETLWNSGVVGLHRADAELCAESLHLTDQLLDSGFGERSHTAEMVAFGVVLSRRSTVRESFDVIRHYWPGEIRKPFGAHLRQAWGDPTLDQQAAFDQLWGQRPRESTAARGRTFVKWAAGKAGVELGRRR